MTSNSLSRGPSVEQHLLATSGGPDGALSRRGFLLGTGLTLAAATQLASWARIASAASATPRSWPGARLGVTDELDQMARGPDEVAYRAFAELAGASATTVRFPLRWDLVERWPGGLDWSRYEPLHRHLAWHGLSALPVIVGTPAWLEANESRVSAGGLRYPVGDQALNALGDFVVATLRYFTTFRDCIDAVEVWTAPNSRSGTNIDDPQHFARMVETAAMSVAVANDAALYERPKLAVAGGLALGSKAKPWRPYLQSAYPDYFPRAIAVHSYANVDNGVRSAREYAERVSDRVVSAVESVTKATDSDVWVTATGATADGPWGEDGQAEALDALTVGLANVGGCRGMMVSPLLPGLGDGSVKSERDSSLLRKNGTAKPAMAALGRAWDATS